MTDDEYSTQFERQLQDLGPLMAEQERLEREEPDPAFTAQLRARLVEQASARGDVRPKRRIALPRFGLGGNGLRAAASAVALAAAAVVLILVLHGGTGPSRTSVKTAWVPPKPSPADLTLGYPSIGGLGGGGFTDPTVSRLPLIVGSAFPGHLTVTAGTLPSAPATVRAYRLRGPGFDVPRTGQIARLLGLTGAVRQTRAYESIGGERVMSTWDVVSNGSATDPASVAISTRTGQVIYHNGTLDPTQLGNAAAPSTAGARTAAQRLLARLGWPNGMPPGPPGPLDMILPKITYTSFGWPGVPGADVPAAAFDVGPGAVVREGLILPPIGAGTDLPARDVHAAWEEVVQGKAPIGVVKAINVIAAAGIHATGTGRLDQVSLTSILSPGAGGTLYLIPVYRFSGTAQFHGVPGRYTWLALVPAA